jgi:hypothetical protein
MSPFEYVIVLISIILGLGITTILTGVAELIKQSKLFILYLPHFIWILLVFVMHIHEWWFSYELKTESVWTLHMFLFILLYPINLYILAHLLFPAGLSTGFTSREFYLNNYPKLFIGTIILDVQSIIHNLVFKSYPIQTQIPHVIVLAVLSAMVLSKTKNSIVHTMVSILLLITMIVSLAFERRTLY